MNCVIEAGMKRLLRKKGLQIVIQGYLEKNPYPWASEHGMCEPNSNRSTTINYFSGTIFRYGITNNL
ncbi:unnamed protein product [Rhizophagus irregularis]|nr:unnamed protein product [Rhizophagus irregularis]CAB5202744.1 unnamed protein product [Rhizophagus irregularis]CAB5386404.1 unnamed protein product [Rhizophagus irregularis]